MEQFQGQKRAIQLLILVFLTGTIGFKIIDPGASWTKAAFMSIVTLSTVGYGEIVNVEGSASAMIFTMVFMLAGLGVLLYVVSGFTAFVVEGHAQRILMARRIRKMIDRLENHYIVCGIGRSGRVVADEMRKTNRPFVMIESNHDHVRALMEEFPDVPVIEGDATDDAVLKKAGIDKAAGVVCCLHEDRDNLLLTVTIKQLRPNIRIVCKVVDVRDLTKLHRAGADSVVSPTLISGMRMASEMIRPHVVSFLDVMLRDKDRTIRVEEVTVPIGSKAMGKTLRDLEVNRRTGLTVVAIWHPETAKFEYGPNGDSRLDEGTVLIVLGNVDNLPKLAALVA